MFRWSQFTNDVTILAEEIRRKRYEESITQVARILGRFLDFIGAYLYREQTTHFPNSNKSYWKVWPHFADLVAASFNLKSFEDLPTKHLPEGLTRWILGKYPEACSKCGSKPCECVVKPWVFENRREDSGAYTEYTEYIEKKKIAKYKLKNFKKDDLSLKDFFVFFNNIYRNGYYKTEIDSIVFHLSEEVGEATTELTRLQLIYLAPLKIFNKQRIEEIKNCVEDKTRIKIPELKEKIEERLKDLHNELDHLVSNKGEIRNKMHQLFGEGTMFNIKKGTPDEWIRLWFIWKISEKFKEELADVASWIAAIACKLGEIFKKGRDGREVINKLISTYVATTTFRTMLKCPSCGKSKCNDKCLVEHSCGKELVEHIMMM